MKSIILLLFTLLGCGPSYAGDDVRQLLQLIDYVGVDYAEAVSDGRVVNPEEYGEMRDFAEAIATQTARLPDSADSGELNEQAQRLRHLIEGRKDPQAISALTARMRATLLSTHELEVVPPRPPNLVQARRLYSEHCASCHGAQGRGDGPLAGTLEPAPTDFQDETRYRQRTLYGLYTTITRGVPGTAMNGFTSLTEAQRWSLAFYTGQLAVDAVERSRGEGLWPQWAKGSSLSDLRTLTTRTPAEVARELGDQALPVIGYLRSHPETLFGGGAESPLSYSAARLDDSVAAYRSGQRERAYRLAVDAYLEGFELVEGTLNIVDEGLRHRIEQAMTGFRGLIRSGAPVEEVAGQAAAIQAQLRDAAAQIDETSLSGRTAFVSALVILLREGLEALLVVAALGAFLIKTGRRDGLPYLYGGAGAALALGILTWWASTGLLDISGAQRELTEGFAALFAAAVLFYVGFWLHSKTSARQWRQFIDGKIHRALNSGTLWGLAGLSFVAVYREVFETVLFYQALWVQTAAAGQDMILTGLAVAGALLVVIAWLILRYSTRLPLRQFFSVTTAFMFVLAFVFAGKGVAALQEAGRIPVDPVGLPSIEILGIYPNLQALAVQALLVLSALFLLFHRRRPPGVSTP